jgi:hypothetical protein
MGGIKPALILSRVMHKRLRPKVNKFFYRVFYLYLPLSRLDSLKNSWWFGINKWGIFSFDEKSYGPRDNTPLLIWIRALLKQNDLDRADGEVVLVTMPKVLGYAFNPVSFWLCHDKNDDLRAVLYEVNNTFGEHHFYLCAHKDQRVIKSDEILEAKKVFHVSPFLERNGFYKFRVSQAKGSFGVWVDYYGDDQEKILLTAVTGYKKNWSGGNFAKAFVCIPLETIKVVLMIHWQALKIWCKKIPYISKPKQYNKNITRN